MDFLEVLSGAYADRVAPDLLQGSTRDFPKTKEEYVNWYDLCLLSSHLRGITNFILSSRSNSLQHAPIVESSS